MQFRYWEMSPQTRADSTSSAKSANSNRPDQGVRSYLRRNCHAERNLLSPHFRIDFMMHRREFVGAAAAFCTFGSLSRALGASSVWPLRRSDSWTSQAVQTIARENAHQPPVVTGVAIQPSGSWVAVAGDDHTVSLLDMTRMAFVSHFARHRDWVRTAMFTPDGKLLATAGNDARLLIWDMEAPGTVRELATQPEAIAKLHVHPDGKLIATVGFDKHIRVYDLANGRRAWSAECPCSDMNAVAFSSDGNWVAAGGRSGIIRIWDSRTANVRTEFTAQRNRVRSIEFTLDGRVISCGDDCTVRVTNPEHAQDAQQLPRHDGCLYAVKLLSDNQLATGGSHDSICIWDLTSLSLLHTLAGHVGTISCLDFANGILVSGSYDTQVRVWQSQTRSAQVVPAAPSDWSPKMRLD